ncbi:MAG TPA: GDSL-type esterase/lipase family protein [Dinghuibacter sp.]|uniref:GDSL-type esterase/lipase family protein n=1 Tax=Dinghuibacter sp. TaxID=2024697 RepID=UPI002B732260|nr:GDSL-type esterase/lipase family protein [Dinghuibacter sp.]HTJ10652.1 GDSL-type esterase/lipase family protein [Dinghuibacter sp.]
MRHFRCRKVGWTALLLGLACAKSPATPGAPLPPADTTATTKTDTATVTIVEKYQTYLALGDSYTIGQSVGDSDRYPVQAVKTLKTRGDTVEPPEIIAVTGWTTANLLYALAQSPPRLKTYSRVTLLIGVNNQYQGGALSTYRTEFTQLLQMAIHWAGDTPAHVVVLSIPDYADSPYGQTRSDTASISAQIDQFNAANYQISVQYGVKYLDITPWTRQAKGNSALFAYDGLHYSGAEMALWAQGLVKLWIN